MNEVLRIEEELVRFRGLNTDCERETYELLLDEFQLVVHRLSPEDDFIWRHVFRVANWLREQTLARTRSGEYDLHNLVARAEHSYGRPLTQEEYNHFRELADEIAEVDRLLTE